ncbi:hypothetical protein [Mesorhizobium sp. YR577]|jgi:hypothetical protein|uniref:hypothetical protein n=1 Tax=Mesorhizobium sp. YR577 TaxID=1884373 RepID=UPI0008E57E42|nr:hypothetical protein [Mesorhizobium sp. YR577]SFT85290.1 hypothetical protein SAMN05518861_106149 [Mesorhizobium sp. YR577]
MPRFVLFDLMRFALALMVAGSLISNAEAQTPTSPPAIDPYAIVSNPHRNIDSLNISNKQQIDCDYISKLEPIVILAVGQSLVANANGSSPWEQRINRNVYEHWGTRCYKANEPLYGASDARRSFVFDLANLITRATQKPVVINMAAVGGTRVERFMDGGDANRILKEQIQNATKKGLLPTFVIWEHGQGNLDDDMADYKSKVTTVLAGIRDQGVTAPIFIAQDSFLNWRSSPEMLQAQRELAYLQGSYLGPNIDLIPFRIDGTHMDDRGVELQAGIWFQVLARYFDW